MSLLPAGKKVFVTGASGFVGRNVVKELLALNHSVVAYARSRSVEMAHPRLKVIQGDLFEDDRLHAAIDGCDAVVHLVGIIFENKHKGITFEKVHIEGTRSVVQAAKAHDIRRFIHMSALGAKLKSLSRYQNTKAQAEQLVIQSGLAFTIFRPSLILGEQGDFTKQLTGWAKGTALPWLFMPYFAKGILGLGGASKVQPVRIETVASVFAQAVEANHTAGRIYNVAGPSVMTWPDMYRAFSTSLLGKPSRTLGIPLWYAGLIARVTPGFLLPFNLDQVRMAAMDNVGDTTELEGDFALPDVREF
jgi:uncharacterized protein YbjT (DUF2867 family)